MMKSMNGKNGSARRCLIAAAFLFLVVGGALFPARAQAADELPPCPKATLASSLRDSAQSHYLIASDLVNQTWAEGIRGDAANPVIELRGSTSKTYCLDKILVYFDFIRKLLVGVEGLEAAIEAFLEEVFNFVCEAVITTVNNLLHKVCVPLPDLGFSLSLPSMERKSCDGTPLATIIPVQTSEPLRLDSELPDDFLSAPLSRWLPDSASINARF